MGGWGGAHLLKDGVDMLKSVLFCNKVLSHPLSLSLSLCIHLYQQTNSLRRGCAHLLKDGVEDVEGTAEVDTACPGQGFLIVTLVLLKQLQLQQHARVTLFPEGQKVIGYICMYSIVVSIIAIKI